MSAPRSAGGWAAIAYTLKQSFDARGGPIAFWRRMAARNTCKTCALGMGGQHGGMTNEAGHFPEFCKKSVQAMAADMQPALAPDFFDRHTASDLAARSPRELERFGRLAYPVVREAGGDRFQPIAWDRALDRIADGMRSTRPERSFFYSSGRSSNEAAFLLQWLARVYGTNNIHNCSYYCHQASGVGLGQTIGAGTATVTLDDLDHADFAMVVGANPASNHPRLISHLVKLRERGGTVVMVNPLREVGLERFSIPSRPGSLVFGSTVSDRYVQPRIGGDIALLKGVLKVVLEAEAIDRAFIDEHTRGFEEVVADLSRETLSDLAANAGVSTDVIVDLGRLYAASKNAILLWAMGITHHAHGVDNVIAIANLALARGMVGRPHAGLLPIRGHSNVQGVGSVGFAPELKSAFLAHMERLYGLKSPTTAGLDSIGSLHAAHRGEIDTAMFLGGNFYAATPDAGYAREALGRIGTTVHVSTKLNQGHVAIDPVRPGAAVFILPTCVRDEESQSTTQESMFSFVRLSDGGASRPSASLKTEVEIITSLGARLLPPDGPLDFSALRTHDDIRRVMARVVPGYAPIESIGQSKKEFHVEGRVRHARPFSFPDGRARFVSVPTPSADRADGDLRLMTIRSEGQFNTVVYEEHDRYRGQASRDVILMNADDMAERQVRDGDRVTVRSSVAEMPDVRVATFDIARGNAAMYYPEANALVDLSVDPKSGTPAFKHVAIRVSAAGRGVR